jgi:hypothetical protein
VILYVDFKIHAYRYISEQALRDVIMIVYRILK